MPIISFTEKDLLRSKIVTPGWYRVRIESVGETPSKDGQSVNYPVEAVIVCNADTGSEEFAGVPIEWNFNSKAPGFMVGFFQALGVEVQPRKKYELSNAAGKEIEVFVENQVTPPEYGGRLRNTVNHKYRQARS
ncbi:MAG: hypothetical protein QXE45_04570 [Thermoplasmata archaeon]